MNWFLALLFPFRSGKQRTVELSMVLVVLSILLAVILKTYHPMVTRAEVLDAALFGLESYKREISYHWALRGEWPRNDSAIEIFHADSFYKINGAPIDQAVLENGAIQIFFKDHLAGAVLSCRPGISPKNPFGPVIWECGEKRRDSTRWQFQGANRTSLDPFFIPANLK